MRIDREARHVSPNICVHRAGVSVRRRRRLWRLFRWNALRSPCELFGWSVRMCQRFVHTASMGLRWWQRLQGLFGWSELHENNVSVWYVKRHYFYFSSRAELTLRKLEIRKEWWCDFWKCKFSILWNVDNCSFDTIHELFEARVCVRVWLRRINYMSNKYALCCMAGMAHETLRGRHHTIHKVNVNKQSSTNKPRPIWMSGRTLNKHAAAWIDSRIREKRITQNLTNGRRTRCTYAQMLANVSPHFAVRYRISLD